MRYVFLASEVPSLIRDADPKPVLRPKLPCLCSARCNAHGRAKNDRVPSPELTGDLFNGLASRSCKWQSVSGDGD